MQFKKVGRIEEKLSVVGYGCWSSAGYNWTGGDVNESEKAIQTAIDMGVNYFDVAPIYGFGESERVLGRAIKGRRDKVFIGTKLGLRWVKPDSAGIRCLSRESIMDEIDQSLERLGVDYVDLIQMHWPDHNTDIRETMEALKDVVKAGKARYVGASNFSVAMLEECDKIHPIASHQVLYNMFDRNSTSYCEIPLEYRTEDEVLPQCEEKGMACFPYSPLCQGVLSGRYYRGRDKDLAASDMRLTNPAVCGDELNKKLDVVDQLKVVAEQADLTLLEMAMGWLMSKPAITSIISGSRTVAQAESSAKCGDIQLSEDVLKEINTILDSSK